MDALTTILTALVLGASEAAKSVANTAVRDGYVALKARLQQRSTGLDLRELEEDPTSSATRGTLVEGLREANAAADAGLVYLAQQMIRIIVRQAPDMAHAAGVRLTDLRAGNITLRDIVSTGSGIVGRNWNAQGDITIEGVRAGDDSPGKD